MKDDEAILGEFRANLGYAEGDEELVKCAHFEAVKSVIEKTV
jgi:hypothetical protein